MLLAGTAIIFSDIGSAILPRASQPQERVIQRLAPTNEEDEFGTLLKKVKRGLQRPSSFRILQKDVAQVIAQTALAAKGSSLSRVPESRPELVEELTGNQEVADFMRKHLLGSEVGKALISRSEMLTEFQRMISILQKADSEFK
jgi:hypothetical protein